jgi:hypothetical protein
MALCAVMSRRPKAASTPGPSASSLVTPSSPSLRLTQRLTEWQRLRDAAGTLGDVLATPRGTAPGRDLVAEVLRREHT